MGIVNGIMNAIGGALFAVLGWMHPVLTILALAVLTAAGSLVVFKWTSNQERIRAAKGQMKAHMLGILLFRHDLRQVFRAIGLALGRSLANLRFLLVPLAVMIVPLVLLFVQMEMRLGTRPLRPGETAVLRVHLREGASLDDVEVESATLVSDDWVRIETPGVRISTGGLNEVDFRVGIPAPGPCAVKVRAGGHEVAKVVNPWDLPGYDAYSAVRTASALDALLYPVEPMLPDDAPVARIELPHPPVTYAFLGIDWAWWVLYLVFMVLALLVLKTPLGVDF